MQNTSISSNSTSPEIANEPEPLLRIHYSPRPIRESAADHEQTAPPQSEPPGVASPTEPSLEDRLFAIGAHCGGLLLWVIAPLGVWVHKKNKSEFVAQVSKEAMNFQICVLLYHVTIWAGLVTSFLVLGNLSVPLGLAVFAFGGIATALCSVFVIVFIVIASMKAWQGEVYRIPLTIRMIE